MGSDEEKPLDYPKIEFAAWYNEVIEKAGLSDKRYPCQGDERLDGA